MPYVWEQLFLSALDDSLALVMRGRRPHLHLFNINNLYHYLIIPIVFQRSGVFFMMKVLDTFITQSQSSLTVNICVVSGTVEMQLKGWSLPWRFYFSLSKNPVGGKKQWGWQVQPVWVCGHGNAWVLCLLGGEYWVCCIKWQVRESLLLQHWKSK